MIRQKSQYIPRPSIQKRCNTSAVHPKSASNLKSSSSPLLTHTDHPSLSYAVSISASPFQFSLCLSLQGMLLIRYPHNTHRAHDRRVFVRGMDVVLENIDLRDFEIFGRGMRERMVVIAGLSDSPRTHFFLILSKNIQRHLSPPHLAHRRLHI